MLLFSEYCLVFSNLINQQLIRVNSIKLRTLLHDSNFLRKLLFRSYASEFINSLKLLIELAWRNDKMDLTPIIHEFLVSSQHPPNQFSSLESCLQTFIAFLVKEGMDIDSDYNIATTLRYSCTVCKSISDGVRTKHVFLTLSANNKTVAEGLKKYSDTVCDSRRKCILCKKITLHAGSVSYSWKDCNVLVIYVPETVDQKSFKVTSDIPGFDDNIPGISIRCEDSFSLFSVVYNQNRKKNKNRKIYSVASRYSHDTSHSPWTHYPDGDIKNDDIERCSYSGARMLFYHRNQRNTTNAFVKFNEQEAFIAEMRSVSKVNYRNMISS